MPISAITTYCKTYTGCSLKNIFKNYTGKVVKPATTGLNADIFVSETKDLRRKLIDIRQNYLQNNKEAFLTLDHIKSNYANWQITNSIKGQTDALDAVSTDDFCGLSEMLEHIRTPEKMTVYRAMEGNDFQVGRIMPEEFFEKYYKEGKTVTVTIYMHTSLDKNIAYRFAKDNPYRFIIKLNISRNTPAVYMEELTPGDVYDFEDELLVTKNTIVEWGKLNKTINPLNMNPIYELEGTVLGHRYIKPTPHKTYNFENDTEYQELIKAIKK